MVYAGRPSQNIDFYRRYTSIWSRTVYNAIDWSEVKNEKISKLDAYVCPNWQNLSIFLTIQITSTYYINIYFNLL